MGNVSILREVTLTLPMVSDMEIAASKTAAELAESMVMSDDKVDEVRMAVVEACINAFEHSDAEDRKVYVNLAVIGTAEPQELQITIRDTGVGFQVDQLVEPRIEEKLKAESKRGWGLKIIDGLMDEVRIDSDVHGTTVVMRKLR